MDFGDNLVLKMNWTPTYVQSAQHPFDLFRVILDSSGWKYEITFVPMQDVWFVET
jgi:hypothetical protein